MYNLQQAKIASDYGMGPTREPTTQFTEACICRPTLMLWIMVPWEIRTNHVELIFKLILVIGGWSISYKVTLRWMTLNLEVKIGSGNAWMPTGNRLLPDPMFTQLYVAIWRH